MAIELVAALQRSCGLRLDSWEAILKECKSAIDVAKDLVHFHDFHATLLHLWSIDHKRLMYRYADRDSV